MRKQVKSQAVMTLYLTVIKLNLLNYYGASKLLL